MSKERAQYIQIEGMDLAGKTTGTRNFIKRTGREWDVRRNSIVPDNPMYKLADSLRVADAYDAETLGNLYVAVLMGDIEKFEWPNKDTIQDSTILLRSTAYHTVRQTPRIVEVFHDLAKQHPQFDASFVFTADLEVRQRRLQSRMDNEPEQVSPDDLLVIQKPDMFMAMEAALIDLATKSFNSVIINTSTLTPEEVVQQMFDNLPEHLK